MRVSRILLRWGSMLLAALALMLVLMIISLSIMPWHLRNVDLSAWRFILPLPENVEGHAEEITLSLDGSVLHINVQALTLNDRERQRTLAAVAAAEVTLAGGSLLQGHNPLQSVMLQSPQLKFYRQPNGGWAGLGAASPAEKAGSALDWETIDHALEQLRALDVTLHDGQLSFVEAADGADIDFVVPALTTTETADGQRHWQASLQRQQHDGPSLIGLGLTTGKNVGSPWTSTLTADGAQLGELLTLLGEPRHYHLMLSGHLNAAFRWANRHLQQADLDLALPAIMVLRDDVVPRQWGQGRLALQGTLEWKGEQWQGQLQNMILQQLDGQGGVGPSQLPEQAFFSGNQQALELQAPTFQVTTLGWLWPLLPVSPSLRHGLQQLDPRGQVAGLTLRFDAEAGLQVEAALQQARLSPWDEIPGIGPFDAKLHTTTRVGQMEATLPSGSVLNLPRVFAAPWQLQAGHAQLDWQRQRDNDWQLDVSSFEAVRDGAHVKGELSLWAPDRGLGCFTLNLDTQNARVTRGRDWLPTRALEPALGQWLADNVRSGYVEHGHVGLTVPIEDELEKLEQASPHSPKVTTTLHFDLRDVALGYLPGWPVLQGVEGHLDYVDDRMAARIETARLHGLKGYQATAYYADDRLKVHAPVTGEVGGLLSILQQAPLAPALVTTLAPWRAGGKLKGTLDVEVPFIDDEEVRVTAQGDVSRGRLDIHPHDLTIDDMQAHADFALQGDHTRLTAKATGRAFDGAAKARLAFKDTEGNIQIEGQAEAHQLLQWLALSGLSPETKGHTPYTAVLDIGEETHLRADSQLKGVAIPLPAPLGKGATESTPLHLDMNLTRGDGSVHLAQRLWARWRDDMTQGQIWIENWPQLQKPWDERPGWTVHWTTPRIALDEWLPAIKALDMSAVGQPADDAAPEATVTDPPLIRGLLVDAPCIALNQQCLGQVRLNGTADRQGLWQIKGEGNLLKGQLTWLPGDKERFALVLDRLALDGLTHLMQHEENQTGNELQDEILAIPRPHVDPLSMPETLVNIPNGTLEIAALELAGQPVGTLQARWRTSQHTLALDTLKLGYKDSLLTLQGRWMQAGHASVTQGRAQLALNDFADILALLGQPQVVHTANGGQIELTFAWPGAPWQATLGTATGTINADVKAGRFTSIDSTSVRLVGLLNLNNLLRRLRLDFADVIHSGTSFNSIKGSGTFSDGILITRRPIEVDAAVTHLTADGQIDLLQRTLNQRIGVTVPVMQGLPIAALLTGLPQLGALLLGSNWLFGDHFNHLTELHYRVEGPWDTPSFTHEGTR